MVPDSPTRIPGLSFWPVSGSRLGIRSLFNQPALLCTRIIREAGREIETHRLSVLQVIRAPRWKTRMVWVACLRKGNSDFAHQDRHLRGCGATSGHTASNIHIAKHEGKIERVRRAPFATIDWARSSSS